MTENETKMIVAQCSAMDNRRITDAAVVMWFEVFRDYSYAEVKWAVIHHYSTSTEYLMPAHLITTINTKRSEWRMMNPVVHVEKADWLEFEHMQEIVADECRKLRESGARSAVDAMDAMDMKELGS